MKEDNRAIHRRFEAEAGSQTVGMDGQDDELVEAFVAGVRGVAR